MKKCKDFFYSLSALSKLLYNSTSSTFIKFLSLDAIAFSRERSPASSGLILGYRCFRLDMTEELERDLRATYERLWMMTNFSKAFEAWNVINIKVFYSTVLLLCVLLLCYVTIWEMGNYRRSASYTQDCSFCNSTYQFLFSEIICEIFFIDWLGWSTIFSYLLLSFLVLKITPYFCIGRLEFCFIIVDQR